MNVLPAPASLLTRHAPAVRVDDALHQAQAEAGALDLRGDGVGGAVERLEDVRLVRGGDPDAAIGDA